MARVARATMASHLAIPWGMGECPRTDEVVSQDDRNMIVSPMLYSDRSGPNDSYNPPQGMEYPYGSGGYGGWGQQ